MEKLIVEAEKLIKELRFPDDKFNTDMTLANSVNPGQVQEWEHYHRNLMDNIIRMKGLFDELRVMMGQTKI